MKKNARILVLDPDKFIREALLEVLSEEGYLITAISEAFEALTLLASNDYAIFITEIKLAGFSPEQFLGEIRRRREELSLIIMSSLIGKNDIHKLFKFRIVDFLIKPVSFGELKAAIDCALKEYWIRQQVKDAQKEIDELKRKYMQTKELLEKANSYTALGKLSRNISHELKNILTAMNLSLYYLEKNINLEDMKLNKHIKLIRESINHGNSLIMELLGIGKKEQSQSCNLNKILEELLAAIENDLKLKNIKLITRFSSPIPEIEIFPQRMKQVFYNIIFNAMEAMPKGGELRIATRLEQINNKKYLLLEFSDTGLGIPDEKRKEIFTPTYTTKDDKGLGLGLYITKNIVEDHGGEIEVESRQGSGTRFKIRLPIEKEG